MDSPVKWGSCLPDPAGGECHSIACGKCMLPTAQRPSSLWEGASCLCDLGEEEGRPQGRQEWRQAQEEGCSGQRRVKGRHSRLCLESIRNPKWLELSISE